MQSTRECHLTKRLPADRTWVIRGAAFGVALILHIACTTLLVIGHSPVNTHRDSALQVRFVKMDRSSAEPPSIHPPPIKPPIIDFTKKQPRSRSVEEAKPASEAATPMTMKNSIDLTLPSSSQGQAYVEGGQDLRESLEVARPKLQIPGEARVLGAPRFQMIDPKTQGLGVGLVRAIGSITGAQDPHCLALDAWQGMTPEQRIENHVSEDDMEKIQRDHNCGAQWRAKHGKGAY